MLNLFCSMFGSKRRLRERKEAREKNEVSRGIFVKINENEENKWEENVWKSSGKITWKMVVKHVVANGTRKSNWIEAPQFYRIFTLIAFKSCVCARNTQMRKAVSDTASYFSFVLCKRERKKIFKNKRRPNLFLSKESRCEIWHIGDLMNTSTTCGLVESVKPHFTCPLFFMALQTMGLV